MMLTKRQAIVAGVVTFIALLIGALAATDAVSWSGEQITLVGIACEATAGFVLAVWWHIEPDTAKEPAAINVLLGIAVASWIYVLNSFDVTHFSEQAIQAIVAAIGSGVLLIGLVFVRGTVRAQVSPPVE